MKIITVEEHFMVKEINDRFNEVINPKDEFDKNQLNFVNAFVNKGQITDVDEQRISFMNKNGIGTQIIGYGNNSPMHISKEDGAVELCKLANNKLAEACKKYPSRFYGYATLPVDDVESSVKELERCVKELGLVGIMINGSFQGHFLDEERFYPIFEKVAELDIPIYLHPTEVSKELRDYYYSGSWNERTTNVFSGFGIGWHYDTAMHLMRFILSGILDKLPNLKIIIGHWAELLPYYFDRMDASLNPQITGLKHNIKYYFYHNVYTNPSGIWSKDDFDFVLKTFNLEHIMWAQDYPYGINDSNVKEFLEKYELDIKIKEMIAYKNAEKLFKIQ